VLDEPAEAIDTINATMERTTRNSNTFFIAGSPDIFAAQPLRFWRTSLNPRVTASCKLSLLRLRNSVEIGARTTSPKWPNYITGICNEM
jgi:hypothetical protein